MVNGSNRREGLDLPPLHLVIQGIKDCTFGCGVLFTSEEKLHQHIDSTHRLPQDIQMSSSPEESSFMPHQQRSPVQPQSLNTACPMDMPSPSSSTDSDGSLSVFSPVNSRTLPLRLSNRRQAATKPYRVRHRTREPSSQPGVYYVSLAGENVAFMRSDKKARKMQKERENRAGHGAVLCREEDMFRNYLGYDRQEQSIGNGNCAGLYANKINIMRDVETLVQHYLDCGYRKALMSGCLAEWQAETLERLERARETRPFAGTLLDSDEADLCDHADSRSKVCSTHGHPDWRECRTMHVRRRFEVNVSRFQSQQRQQQQEHGH